MFTSAAEEKKRRGRRQRYMRSRRGEKREGGKGKKRGGEGYVLLALSYRLYQSTLLAGEREEGKDLAKKKKKKVTSFARRSRSRDLSAVSFSP